MPCTQSAKVLVSGGNGFVSTWAIQTFLDAGFSVRGTVRSAAKERHLKRFFALYGEKFELVVVPDVTAIGAFDEAVQGVDAIAHTPFHGHLSGESVEDPADLFAPAARGTLGILESARKYGTGVKRVVISCASSVGDDAHWNTTAVQAVSAEDCPFNSKALAEWSFLDRYRTAQVGWDIAVLAASATQCHKAVPAVPEVCTSVHDTMEDALADYEARGWIKPLTAQS